jgi:FG-GAP-like repeat
MMLLSTEPDTRRLTPVPHTRAGLETLEPRWLLSGSLTAEFVWVDNTSELTGYTTADLQVTTDSDWTGAALLLDLTQGSIYQDANGGDTAPSAALFGAFPTLEFDTYVAANGNSVNLIGAAGDVGGDAYQFDTEQLDLTWIDLSTDDTGTINIGRVTLSDDAVGTWSLKLVNADGETYTTLSNAFTNGGLAPPPPPPDPAVDGDFTGDGKADIFWHNTSSGRNCVWEMDGTDFVLETSVRRLRNTDWKLVGTGDFTGDGKNDLFWRNTSDGRNSIWEMDGTTFQGAITIKKLSNFAWQVTGVGDFTGDGKDDILWRNTRDGRNTVWEMNGTDFVGGVAIKTLANQQWRATGVGDFTGDGKDDILWRHTQTGRNTVWEMDGSAFTTAISIKRVKNLAWQIAGVGDYTGDGVTDILWRNTTTGANTVWEMNGTALVGGVALPTQTDLDEQPASPILGLWEA